MMSLAYQTFDDCLQNTQKISAKYVAHIEIFIRVGKLKRTLMKQLHICIDK